ncbi:hypothetical protein QFZ36_001023 [Pseudarthrobacter siccitolerans]|uniref:Uncharacterized protein n=1 Tax=Pseudarthrobacter siccitolerans TaxID=861266 RepID=A0ABU0PIC9_9MICC|nr:hypothetical protein [Pseudarthrobacter siccitolerans]
MWAKRVWWRGTRTARGNTISEEHPLAGPRGKPTARAVGRATEALQRLDTSDSALAHQFCVSWHNVWDASRQRPRDASASRAACQGECARRRRDVSSHIVTPGSKRRHWIPSPGTRTRSATNCPKPSLFRTPFVVKRGSAMVDEVRRRVQQCQRCATGRKGDPLYGIRRPLQIDTAPTPHRQTIRPAGRETHLGDPDYEVTLAWQCYQKLRHIYHARAERGRDLVNEVIASFSTCRSRKSPPLPHTQAMEERDLGLFRHERRLE